MNLGKKAELFNYYECDVDEEYVDLSRYWKIGNIINIEEAIPSPSTMIIRGNLKPIFNFGEENRDMVYIPEKIIKHIKNPFDFYEDVSHNLRLNIKIGHKHPFFVNHVIEKKPLPDGKFFNVSGLETFKGFHINLNYFKCQLSEIAICNRFQMKYFTESDKSHDVEW